jgi:FKBP-type peptidyl-prolyl cis-trans isomerase
LQYRNDKDSVVFDSRTGPTRRKGDSIGIVTIPLEKTFNGCLEQGITLMAAGDSAEFLVNTDSLFFKTFKAKSLPPFAHSGTMLTFDLKLVKFQTKDEIEKEKQELIAKQQAQMQQAKDAEPGIISKYLSDNKLNVQPTGDGMYILQDTQGPGKQVSEGDSVEVTYKGPFLDGKIFDQSSAHGGKGTFEIQYSQSARLIRGWIILIGTMKEGQKTTVLIPSKLAYGDRGFGGLIPPFTPLIFEIEIVRVSHHG